MTHRLILDYNFPVKAKKGERRGPNGSLIKSVQFFGANVADVLADAKSNAAAMCDAVLLSATLHDDAAFRAGNYNGEDITAQI